MNSGISNGINDLICVVMFFEFILELCDFCVKIILFNLFINVGMNCNVMDIIIFNWWIGNLNIFSGVSNFLNVFVKLIGFVDSVIIVVIIIILIKCSDIYSFFKILLVLIVMLCYLINIYLFLVKNICIINVKIKKKNIGVKFLIRNYNWIFVNFIMNKISVNI